ncbi:hypothetical protein DL765_011175 [Monosporascus sp. GIB2]|nr:hypothetical protein DL765_011175 [Monosporascus sp. GIB2]
MQYKSTILITGGTSGPGGNPVAAALHAPLGMAASGLGGARHPHEVRKTDSAESHAALEIAKRRPQSPIVPSSRTDTEQAADKINKALGQSNTIFLPLDLGDLANVRACAREWKVGSHPPIEALVVNDGLQSPGNLMHTRSGLEAAFVISHVGHALLLHLLAPASSSPPAARTTRRRSPGCPTPSTTRPRHSPCPGGSATPPASSSTYSGR